MDRTGDKIGGKIRNAEIDKVHTMLLVGQKEQDAEAIAVRIHGKGDQGARPRGDVISGLLDQI